MRILAVEERLSIPCHDPLHLKSVVAETRSDVARSLQFHAPLQCTVGRALHGLLMTNQFSEREPGAEVLIQSAHGERTVAIELNDGEEVCFSFHHLIGFSARVSFRAIIDWAVTSWAAGRPVVSVARGPGLLFFRCAGSPAIWDSERPLPETQRIQCSRLVVWPADASFCTDSLESVWDIWFGELRLFMRCPRDGGHVVMDVDHVAANHHRLWDLIKNIYRFW